MNSWARKLFFLCILALILSEWSTEAGRIKRRSSRRSTTSPNRSTTLYRRLQILRKKVNGMSTVLHQLEQLQSQFPQLVTAIKARHDEMESVKVIAHALQAFMQAVQIQSYSSNTNSYMRIHTTSADSIGLLKQLLPQNFVDPTNNLMIVPKSDYDQRKADVLVANENLTKKLAEMASQHFANTPMQKELMNLAALQVGMAQQLEQTMSPKQHLKISGQTSPSGVPMLDQFGGSTKGLFNLAKSVSPLNSIATNGQHVDPTNPSSMFQTPAQSNDMSQTSTPGYSPTSKTEQPNGSFGNYYPGNSNGSPSTGSLLTGLPSTGSPLTGSPSTSSPSTGSTLSPNGSSSNSYTNMSTADSQTSVQTQSPNGITSGTNIFPDQTGPPGGFPGSDGQEKNETSVSGTQPAGNSWLPKVPSVSNPFGNLSMPSVSNPFGNLSMPSVPNSFGNLSVPSNPLGKWSKR